jgi:type I restriction-modification system DNA methylase subunit/REP element-mobilizing transposase RayT
MSLFQLSVLNKHLASQNAEAIKTAFQKYSAYFLNKEIQQNIRNSKEEQFQEGFLRELFVNILGYTINPNPNFNFTTELKNIKDAKKTDGAILNPAGAALAVIELKGTDTKDLDKVNDQAFNYKNNQPECIYVITSNFEKLRFYIHNAVEHEEFNLFALTPERFALLWLFLQKDNLLGGIPAKVKEESLLQEDRITKALYADYSAFKNDLWNNMVQLNPQHDPLLLYKKSQKLLDRFLFIFFAEDKGLLPPNSISVIIEQWQKLKDLDEYKPLYSRFKKYFGYMNDGYKGAKYEIHAYNGGLFKADPMLDGLLIDDTLLQKHCRKLTNYDFADEVDTNILGHIFEHSLNDIENVRAQLAGEEVDKSKTKRKKDGVFYTPKYITKYIVDNTIGKLCEEKKAELEIDDEEFAKDRKGRRKETIKKLDDQLKKYRAWLLQLTICDPACGSGAFLNQALEFLMAEHRYVDELEAQLFEGGIVFQNVENHILENNIYGVDINEESVEIARLSLWLRTAQKGRKLTSLSSNIKCGNSLIDDPEVAGDLAFNWQKEFPTVFQEKEKRAYHITTATHDSRTSQRMIDHKVRQKRDNGTRPYPEAIWLEPADEEIIMQTLAGVVKEDKLNILAANICGDHLHLLLVCEEDEVPKIVKKIKGRTSRMLHFEKGDTSKEFSDKGFSEEFSDKGFSEEFSGEFSNKGFKPLVPQENDNEKPLVEKETEKSIPLWTQKFGCQEITSQEQLNNTIHYIENNRTKHELPPNTTLQKHINSLVCTYDEAFATEYKGGFDVVIGNPPYVRAELLAEYREFFSDNYKVFDPASDLFAYFYELGTKLIRVNNGIMGFISNTFDKTTAGEVLRKYLVNETCILDYVDFTEVQIFEGATTYPVILLLKRNAKNNSQFTFTKIPKIAQNKVIDIESHQSIKVFQETLEPSSWSFLPIENVLLFNKLLGLPSVKAKYGKSYRGLITGLNEAFILNNDWPFSEHIKSIYEGKELKKWNSPSPVQKLLLFPSGWTKLLYGNEITEVEAMKKLHRDFPEMMEHLAPYEEKGKKRFDKGDFWWELRNCAYYHLFEEPKIVFPNLQNSNKFSFEDKGVYINAPAVFLPVASKTLLCVLNSKLVWEFLKSICVVRSGGYIEVKPQYFEQIPVPEFGNEANFEKNADAIISATSELQNITSSFLSLLQSKFDLPKPSTKLQQWPTLDFKGFLAELKKAKAELNLEEEAEWMTYFNKKKAEANALQNEIDRIDKEIDQMVYALYGLTEEEIAIVENS